MALNFIGCVDNKERCRISIVGNKVVLYDPNGEISKENTCNFRPTAAYWANAYNRGWVIVCENGDSNHGEYFSNAGVGSLPLPSPQVRSNSPTPSSNSNSHSSSSSDGDGGLIGKGVGLLVGGAVSGGAALVKAGMKAHQRRVEKKHLKSAKHCQALYDKIYPIYYNDLAKAELEIARIHSMNMPDNKSWLKAEAEAIYNSNKDFTSKELEHILESDEYSNIEDDHKRYLREELNYVEPARKLQGAWIERATQLKNYGTENLKDQDFMKKLLVKMDYEHQRKICKNCFGIGLVVSFLAGLVATMAVITAYDENIEDDLVPFIFIGSTIVMELIALIPFFLLKKHYGLTVKELVASRALDYEPNLSEDDLIYYISTTPVGKIGTYEFGEEDEEDKEEENEEDEEDEEEDEEEEEEEEEESEKE